MSAAGHTVLELLQAQQRQMALLSSRISMLHEEHEALCECLTTCGAVSADRLLAHLHRRRFSAALRRHSPGRLGESLETVMQTRELALLLAARAGLAAAAAVSVASQALRRSTAAAAPDLAALFPVMLYAVGGEAGGAAMASVESLDVLRGVWTETIPLAMPRSGCAAVAMGGHLYVAGGCSSEGEDLSSVERLDLRSAAWEPQPSMEGGRDELAAVAAGRHIFAVGGSHLVWPVRHVVDTVERLEPGAVPGEGEEVWFRLPSLRQERCAAAAVWLQGALYVLGGCDEDGTALDTAERLVPGAAAWETLPRMARPRCNFAAAAARGRLFVAGGYDDRMRDLESVECLDPVSCTWEVVASLSVPRWGVRAVGRGGLVFIVGGHARDGEVGDVDRLDLGTGRWAALPPLAVPRRSFGLAAVLG